MKARLKEVLGFSECQYSSPRPLPPLHPRDQPAALSALVGVPRVTFHFRENSFGAEPAFRFWRWRVVELSNVCFPVLVRPVLHRLGGGSLHVHAFSLLPFHTCLR